MSFRFTIFRRIAFGWGHRFPHASAIRGTTTIVFVGLLFFAALLGADSPVSVVEKVRQGIEYFRNNEFSKAETEFSEAAEIDPENATIVFDEACAAMAGGDVEQARSLFRKSAAARQPQLSVQAHYNLGCLEADHARTKLGDDPFAATGELREESISLLLTSVRHYRDVLRIDGNHKAARHNLELIRLYIKHLQSKWEERDREKARQEKNLLQFLKMIEEQQTKIRSVTRRLNDEADSVRKRQAISESEKAQQLLQEEIAPLQEKIQNEFQPPATQPAAPAGGAAQPGGTAQSLTPEQEEQRQQAEALLLKLAEETGNHMSSAARQLKDRSLQQAQESQTEALNLLNQLYMAVAPYPDILQRSVTQQAALTDGPVEDEATDESSSVGEPAVAAATDDDPTVPSASSATGTDAESGVEETDYALTSEQQSRISDWSQMLSLKAEQALPEAKSQLESLQQPAPPKPAPDLNQDATSPNGDDETTNENAETDNPSTTQDLTDEQKAALELQEQTRQQVEQMEGLVRSMELAVEHAPEVQQHSQTAFEFLQQEDETSAEPKQQEALEILKKIAEPLQQENDQQDDQQQNQNQNEQDQNTEENKSNEDSQDKGNDDQEKNSEQNQDDSKSENEKEQQQQKSAAKRQAESVMRDARERERKYRELQKMFRVPIKVDKDW